MYSHINVTSHLNNKDDRSNYSWPFIFDKHLVYRNYVTEVIEFKNTNGIYKKGTNDRSIFGAEPSYSPHVTHQSS
jgi:hypothetical protein